VGVQAFDLAFFAKDKAWYINSPTMAVRELHLDPAS